MKYFQNNYLRRIAGFIFVALFLVYSVGCTQVEKSDVISKQYKVVDLYIGDVIKPELQHIPKSLNESDYIWTLESDVYSEGETGLKEIGSHEYEAVKSDFVTIKAEAELKGKIYRESFRYYIYPNGDIQLNLKNNNVLGNQEYVNVTVVFPEDMVEKGFDMNRITIETDEALSPYYERITALGIERGKEIPYQLLFSGNDTGTPITGTVTFRWGKSEAECEITLFNDNDPFQIVSYLRHTGKGAQVNDTRVMLPNITSKYNKPVSEYENRFAENGSGKYAVVYNGQVMVDYMMKLPDELLPDSAGDVDYLITILEGNPIQVATLRNDKIENPVPGLVSTCDIVLLDAQTGDILRYFAHYEGEMKDKYADNAYTSETEWVYLGYAEPDFDDVIEGIWEERSISVIR